LFSHRYGGTSAAAAGIVNKALPDVPTTIEVASNQGVFDVYVYIKKYVTYLGDKVSNIRMLVAQHLSWLLKVLIVVSTRL
jgi:hypothetical protein